MAIPPAVLALAPHLEAELPLRAASTFTPAMTLRAHGEAVVAAGDYSEVGRGVARMK